MCDVSLRNPVSMHCLNAIVVGYVCVLVYVWRDVGVGGWDAFACFSPELMTTL